MSNIQESFLKEALEKKKTYDWIEAAELYLNLIQMILMNFSKTYIVKF